MSGIELIIVSGIVWLLFGGSYAFSDRAFDACLYSFDSQVTTWRLRFRRTMNAADNKVAGRLVDSFVNIETVRLFGNEDYESMPVVVEQFVGAISAGGLNHPLFDFLTPVRSKDSTLGKEELQSVTPVRHSGRCLFEALLV